jgi:hypothetical protein
MKQICVHLCVSLTKIFRFSSAKANEILLKYKLAQLKYNKILKKKQGTSGMITSRDQSKEVHLAFKNNSLLYRENINQGSQSRIAASNSRALRPRQKCAAFLISTIRVFVPSSSDAQFL